MYPDLHYITCDAPEKREILREVHSAQWGKVIGNAVIDEVQKEPSVFEKIKSAYDGHQISFSLLLGSSQILLLKRYYRALGEIAKKSDNRWRGGIVAYSGKAIYKLDEPNIWAVPARRLLT